MANENLNTCTLKISLFLYFEFKKNILTPYESGKTKEINVLQIFQAGSEEQNGKKH